MNPALTPSGVYAQVRMRAIGTSLKSGVVSAAAARAATLDPSVGATYADQLAAKTELARAALERYTTIGAYDAAAAEAAIAAIEAWRADHASVWSKIEQKVLGTDVAVASDEALTIPVALMKAYVEALFLTAAYSLNLYTHGVLATQVANGRVTAAYVQNDADARLNMLDVVLTLDAAGTLETIYRGAPNEAGALQGIQALLTPQVLIGILVVAAIVVLVGGIVYYRQASANNALKLRLCDEYVATHDESLAGACDPTETDAVTIAKYAIGVSAAAALVYFLFPQIPALVKGLRS